MPEIHINLNVKSNMKQNSAYLEYDFIRHPSGNQNNKINLTCMNLMMIQCGT